ncbi:sugar transporter [Histidinibacterium aquaticum]|uniref:Sugar transporter n=1 Tax=Histidinibacterium aquaticum TaxID=2613962 RepID=A0A5J5GCD1_9RHOB|nr:sugar transporter [Histidinibacterium aquaticum]KAA9005094.1 sugar transporter [Histidinibacterium aquaticum]
MADQAKPDRPSPEVTFLRQADEPRPKTPEAPAEKTEPKPKPKPESDKGGSGKPAPKKGGQKKPLDVVEVTPAAKPARMRKRHWGLLFLFLLTVVAPLGVAGWYLWERAEDQYASTVGFTVRQEENTSASALLGGLTSLTGGAASTDANILYEFIQSQSLVSSVNERLNLIEAYSAPYEQDPVFALDPNASLTELTDYWRRMVRISFDEASGLVELRILAFEPEFAQSLAQEILDESQVLINELNAAARSDTISYAEADLEEALERVRDAREALTLFRTRTQIVDPETDIQGRMGVLNNLQQQLAQALIEYDLLVQSTSESDPRVSQVQSRIDVIRERISEERSSFATEEANSAGEDYPTLMAEYESLTVDREFAEETYRAALAALDAARSAANRQTRYLAAYIQPTYPEVAEFPRRWVLMGIAALFLFLAWAIISLVYYSIRDSR